MQQQFLRLILQQNAKLLVVFYNKLAAERWAMTVLRSGLTYNHMRRHMKCEVTDADARLVTLNDDPILLAGAQITGILHEPGVPVNDFYRSRVRSADFEGDMGVWPIEGWYDE